MGVNSNDAVCSAKGMVPCPFCASTPEDASKIVTSAPGIVYAVKCADCGCQGPSKSNCETAIESWNRRNNKVG